MTEVTISKEQYDLLKEAARALLEMSDGEQPWDIVYITGLRIEDAERICKVRDALREQGYRP